MMFSRKVVKGKVHRVQKDGFEMSSSPRFAGRNIPHLNFILETETGECLDVLFKGSTKGTIADDFLVEVEGFFRKGRLQALKIVNLETNPPSVIASK